MLPINVWSPSGSEFESYGRLAVNLSDGLHTLGYHANLLAADGCGSEIGSIIPTKGGFVLGYPTKFHKFGSLLSLGPQIALTMFESTMLPRGWRAPLNRCDAIIVPSKWLVDVFVKNGVKVPVHCVPLAISGVYEYRERNFKAPYNFIIVADENNARRKGLLIAVAAFISAFGEDENYHLTIKARQGRLNKIFSHPNISVIAEDISENDLVQLYHQHQFMLAPTRGEGFGYLPREFARTGGISITTNWGGTADELSKWGVGIQAVEERAWQGNKQFDGLGVWGAPDISSLVHILSKITQYDKLNEVALEHSEFVKDFYSMKKFSEACYSIYSEYL